MPVAFLIHGRKKEKVHSRFFEFVSSVLKVVSQKNINGTSSSVFTSSSW
jgi:hypothetical protein